MDDLVFWLIARVTGLTAFAVLSLALLSGEALRTSVLDFLATNRAIRKLHDFTTPLWLPLVFAHIVALVLDRTAQIRAIDVVVPFINPYEPYLIPIGLDACQAAICERDRNPSLSRMRCTCPSAVRSLITSRSAMSRFVSPSAT